MPDRLVDALGGDSEEPAHERRLPRRPIERFRRAHVKPARKRRGWRRWSRPRRCATCVVAGRCALRRVPRRGAGRRTRRVLQIDRIVVRGNERLSTGEVLARARAACAGENLVWTDLDGWRERLLASPWVRDAALRRSLPSTVEVVVSERQPIGIGRIDGELYLVDERGVIIDQYGPQYADLDLPIVDGLAAAPADGGIDDRRGARRAGGARHRGAAGEAGRSRRRLSQIDVTDVHNAAVILERRSGGDSPRRRPVPAAAASRTSSSRRRCASASPDIDYVDLRFDDRDLRAAGGRAPRRPRRGSATGSREQADGRAETGGRVARKERYLVGLDVGTSKVTAVVGEMLDGDGARHRRPRRRRVARHPARRRRQPRGGGRVDQEGDRGGRADGRRRDRLGAPGAVGPAHQGLQQPRRDRGRRQEPRDHARGRAARHRRRQGGVAADRPRDPARAAAGLRRRRAGRHRRAGRA